MSSILKALKKLEQEKTGRFPVSLNIDSDILKTADTSRSFSPLVLSLLFLLVFGGGAAVAFYFMKAAKAPQATAELPQVTTVKSITLPVSPPEGKPETPSAEIAVVPAQKEPSGGFSRKQLKRPADAVKAADSSDSKPIRAAVSGISVKPKEPKEPKEPDGTATMDFPAATIVPALRVNGIAFQNSGDDSMAIVNGIPVSNGSIIEGIAVEEVRKDRVLFRHNGKKFEIQLGQSNR